MTAKKTLSRIRGWFPQEPLYPRHLKIKLETNPVKFRHRLGKSPINTVQLLTVVLAVSLILGGLYLNSISTTRDEFSLPISSTAYNTPLEYNQNNYNYCVYLHVSPPLSGSSIGPANYVSPLSVYLKDPQNISSGVYFVTLRYLSYNTSIDAYSPRETNYSQTYSVDTSKKDGLIIGTPPMSPPFEEGQTGQSIVNDVVFTIYCNATAPVYASLFSIKAPIDLTQSAFVVTYPYRTVGNILLSVGIVSLILALFLSVVNVKRNFGSYQVKTGNNSENAQGFNT